MDENRAKPSVDIVIPAYNESAGLRRAIDAAVAYLDDRGLTGHVLVVNDGSTDDTGAIAAVAAYDNPRVRDEGYERNRGKGYAVRWGAMRGEADLIVFLDADLATPVDEIDPAVAAMANGADVIIGTRHDPRARIEVPQPLIRRVMGAGFRWLTRRMLGLRVSDITCGFKAFTREAAREIFPRSTVDGWAFDAELLVIAQRLGLSVAEVPVRWADRRESRVRPLANAIESWRQLRLIRRNLQEGAYEPGGSQPAA